MSGPVTTGDKPALEEHPEPEGPTVEISRGREARVGDLRVRRALPSRPRRTVGAWCFADHMGPAQIADDAGVGIGPHPHIGLQTVTWLFEGEILHRDSLGSEQPIRPGQLNLMTAGNGVSHAEEGVAGFRGELHGMQLWVAQPNETRHGPAAFEHHAELPSTHLPGVTTTVLVGTLAGATSPARHDTDLVGAQLDLDGGPAVIPVQSHHEHALVVAEGSVEVDGQVVEPGNLAYLGMARDELALSADGPSRALLLGGVPFGEPVLMWWNFVARTREEISEAQRAWATGDADRFGRVASHLDRFEVGPPPWAS